MRREFGIRARLITTVSAIVILTLAVAFFAVYRQTTTQLRSQLDRSLRSAVSGLTTSVLQGSHAPAAVLAAARAYVVRQPYGDAAILLFATVPGAGEVANHPELIDASSRDDEETSGQQSSENRQALQLARPRTGFWVQSAPDVGRLRIFERVVPIGQGRRMYAAAAEPLSGIRSVQHGVLRSFALAGFLALLVALAATYLTGSRISAPLRRLARLASGVDAGELTPRIELGARPGRELRALGDSFNHMLDRLQAAFSSQRSFVEDASHELRTPITVIRGQLDLLSSGEAQPTPADLARSEEIMGREIARLSRMTEELLLLARAEGRDFLRREPVLLVPFVNELWDGLSLLAERNFVVGQLPDVRLLADPDRLAQALRNLAVNAISVTTEPDGLIMVSAELREGMLHLIVRDDGPGISREERERIFDRFHRGPGARQVRGGGGAGLGLAIVRAIVSAHGGQVSVEDAEPRGAAFRIVLPLG